MDSSAAPRLPLSSKLLYATGMLGYASMLRLVVGWLNKYLVPPEPAIAIVPLIVVGGMMAFGRFYIDAVTDPAIGYWSDRARTPWGRRKPFILAGALPTVFCMVGLFMLTPEIDVHYATLSIFGTDVPITSNGILYAGLVTGFWVGSTLLAMPYLAMIPEIAPHENDRKQLTTMLAVCMVLGTALGQVFLPGTFGVRNASLVCAGLGCAAFFCIIVLFREPWWVRQADGREDPPEPRPDRPVTQVTKVRAVERGETLGLAGGLWVLFVTMAYGALLYVLTAVWLPLWIVLRVVGAKVPLVLIKAPKTLRPLGHSLGQTFRFKPFVGFSGAFVALHAAFVLLTVAILYIPQTLMGGNTAENYLDVAAQSSEWHPDGVNVLSASELSLAKAEFNRLRVKNSGNQLEGATFGQRLVVLGIITQPNHASVLKRVDSVGTSRASIYLGATLATTLFIGVPLIYFMLGRVGHKNTGTFCLWLFMIGPLGILLVGVDWLPIPSDVLMYSVAVAVGISLAGIFVLDNLLLSDIIEMDMHITGERRESTFFGIYYLLMKIGIGFAYILSTTLFAVFGYSMTDPWGVRLSGPVASMLALGGSLLFWAYFPHKYDREHVQEHPQDFYFGTPPTAFADAAPEGADGKPATAAPGSGEEPVGPDGPRY